MHCVTFEKLFNEINELINEGGDKTWDLQYTKLNDTDPDDGVGTNYVRYQFVLTETRYVNWLNTKYENEKTAISLLIYH